MPAKQICGRLYLINQKSFVTIYKTPIFADESLVTITNRINNYYIHLLLW